MGVDPVTPSTSVRHGTRPTEPGSRPDPEARSSDCSRASTKRGRIWLQDSRQEGSLRQEIRLQHRLLKEMLLHYIFRSRFLVLLTTPFIYACLIPVALMDLICSTYQWICFPIYGIPAVRRSDYLAFDRHHLSYLNLIEKINCEYCAYANGILHYVAEISARTEQYWCPIKHFRCVKCTHKRYKNL